MAGAHGRNAEEFVDRVYGAGVDSMTAMVSANSWAAEAMGLVDQIGSIDITAGRRVVFVMKGGVVYKYEERSVAH